MNDQTRTKEQLIPELQALRQQAAELQESENQRKQAEAEIQRRLQEAIVLSQVTNAIALAVDTTDALHNVCAELARFLQVPQASFAILNPQRTAAEVIATYQPPGSPSTIGVLLPVTENPSMAYILEHKAPLTIIDAQTDPLLTPVHELMRKWNIQSILIVPIIVGGEVIGTLGLDSFERRVFSDSDIGLTQHVVSQVGQVLTRKQTEDALRESEEKYRVLVNTSIDSMISVDPQMKITLWNKGAEKIFGYTEAEMLGQTIIKIIPERYRKSKKKGFAEFEKNGLGPVIGKTLELEGLRKDGTEVPVELSVSSRRVGETYIATAIARDITERKRAEAEHEQLLAALEHRSTQLQTAAEVSRAASSILDPEVLIPQVVDLVCERFGLYYAGLFLVDQAGKWTGEPGKWAVLRAGSGEAGRQMLKQGHKLEIGVASMIGWCIANKQARISLDVGEDAVRFENPLLPDTRSELALPLISRSQAIGALTIQSSQGAAFSEEDIAVLQTMAEQLANAITNARLYEQSQQEITERKRAEEAQITRLRYEEGLAACSQTLLADTAEALSEALCHLQTASDVSRVYIFENFEDPLDELCMRQTHEACAPGTTPKIDNPDLQHLLYKDRFIRWQEELSKGKPITGLVQSFPQSEREILEPQDTLSILVLPIRVEGEWYGFIGFDDTVKRRQWNKKDIRLLQTAAGMIGAYIEQKLAKKALQKAHKELERYTDSLKRRTAQLQVGAEVAREAAAILDVRQLLNTTVRLVSERFGFYHAGVFLVDEQGEYAVLRAASSEGGRRMLERGHRLQIGKVGTVGHVAETGEPRIDLDAGKNAVFFNNLDLPDTRSEMGLPLKVRGRVIGVLDVQSTQEAAFSEDDVVVLQTLADQLAVAIENARLVERTEAQLRELNLLYGEYSATTWAELASPEHSLGYVYDRVDVIPTKELPPPAFDLVLERGETVALVEPETTEMVLATPLRLRDQIIGTLGIQETDMARGWSPDEIAIVEAVSDQVTQALENAQLFAETQKSAQQMQALNELGQALATRLNVEKVLKEAYRGASRLLDTTNFYVGLYDPEKDEINFAFDAPESGGDKQYVTLLHDSEKDEINFAFDAPESGDDKQYITLPANQGLAGYVIQNHTSVLIQENVPEWLEKMGIEQVGRLPLSWLGVPLLIGDRVLGVMAVQSYTTPRAYDEHDRDLLTTIASQTAIALQNAYLFRETEAALAETEVLYRVGNTVSRLGSLEETFQTLANVLVERLGYASSWLALVDKQTQMLKGITSAGMSVTKEDVRLEHIPLDPQIRNPAIQAVLSREFIVVNDALTDERIADVDHEIRAIMGRVVEVPILVGNEAAGILAVSRPSSMPEITNRDVEVLRAVADQAAVALQNARLLEETQRRASQLAAAAEVARGATAILDVDQLLDEAVHLISEQFNFYHAGVFLLDEQDEYAILRAASSEGGRSMLARNHKLRVGKTSVVGHVAAAGKTRVALDVGADAVSFNNPDLPDTRSEMAWPLQVRGRVIGVLDVQSIQESAFSKDDVAALQTMADQLATAIANARLFQEVRADAMRRALINEVQQAAAVSLDPNELLHRAGEAISRRLQRRTAVLFWEPEDENLRPVAVHDAQAADVPLVDSVRVTREMNPTLFSKVIDRRRTSVLDARAQYLDRSADILAEQLGIQAGIYVPLTTRDQMLGALAIALPEGHLSEEMDFIEIIGANLSVALENAMLYQDAVETTEQLKEMDRLKSQFLANMSHELRTPLNSVIGFSRVILKGIDGPLTDMQHTDLQAVYNSGQHLLGLINDILEISKIQAGKMELSFEDTDLREIIKGVMSTAIALVKDKPIELQQSVPPDLPTIRADSRRIRQVLINLVGNAAKFTEEGLIRIEAKAGPTEVIISVTDSGIGIPPDQLEIVFEAFTQVDGSSTRRAGGTGLGLSIANHFVEMHDGRIWVESTLNAGSTFYVALPIEGPPEFPGEEKAGEPKTEQPEPKQESDQRLVLCVDDDEGVITLFRRYLSKQGYKIVGLTDSTAVVEKVRQLKPFAITLDVMMPNKDGWLVIQELKANPDTRDIPVVMCSIASEKEYGLSLGASDYLLKPILEEDLVDALERLDQEEGPHLVLVVDDQPGDRNLLRRMIEAYEGYEVVEAAGGQEAITLIRQVRPNIIILDLMMPDIDGFAVLESVKADKTTRSIPIIVVTAKVLTQEERDILNERVEALLQKGLFDQQELLADVAAVLERIKTDRK